MGFEHKPVLLRETIEGLAIKPRGTYVDCTLGGGGHSGCILEKLNDQGRLIGIDQDGAAVAAAGERLKGFTNVTIVRDNYCNIRQILESNDVHDADGILLDLGVSSYQLDTPGRGFSYNSDGPLDMRMDDRGSVTAADIVNTYSEKDLTRIIRTYGEERFAASIAKHITAAREGGSIKTTGELVEIIRGSIPAKFLKTSGHPAKQTFQAIRIELNNELKVLADTLDTMIDLLTPGGRIAVITFHSLEDRIVKNAFKVSQDPCTCPPDFPVCVCNKVSKGSIVTKKPVTASEEELTDNPRAKSAKLRIFEKRL
ncbi:MAG: 16S rRNA (cytosine(1402)-N(4))-methyltransferase RsmH [Lachnospiraceae bacterium]|nr:16S rRNA (cytosine(1402)-N(4))-methyltransferase RsmH [Lachnospiraceae bacterium]